MLQLLVVAVGNLCRQDSQRLDLGYNLGGHRVLSWGIFQQSLPLRDGIPPGVSASYCSRDLVNGQVGVRRAVLREEETQVYRSLTLCSKLQQKQHNISRGSSELSTSKVWVPPRTLLS